MRCLRQTGFRAMLGVSAGLLAIIAADAAFGDTGGDDFKAKSADYFEHTIDFMVTIALGAFAVLGYLIKDSVLTSGGPRESQLLAASLAMVMGALSLYFGYQSYLNLVSMTGSGTFNFGAIPDSYALQALFLLLEGLFIFLALVITVLRRELPQQAPDPRSLPPRPRFSRPRLPWSSFLVIAFCAATSVGASAGAMPAQADTLSIQFDWTGITALDRVRIAMLQQGGRLPVPLIYIDGKPVGMVGDSFDFTTVGDKVTIDVGVSKLLERPLYSILLPVGDNASPSAVVTSSQLAPYKKIELDRLPVILEGVGQQVVAPIVNAEGTRTIDLPAKAYLDLANIIEAQAPETQWSDWMAVDMYHRDTDTGNAVQPVFATIGTPRNVIRADESGTLAQPYAKNVDVSWLTDLWRNLLTEPPEKLMLKSTPGSAEIHVSGVKQSQTTEAEISVVRYLWSEIFIRKDKYRPCQVDPLKVTPPLKTGDPAVFVCKLVKKK